MANPYDDIVSMVRKVIADATRYFVPRIGRVAKVDDDLSKGRILVLIDAFGWDTEEKGAWCFPKQLRSLITPKKDDFVLVEFIDGDRNLPVYSAISSQMKDMLPQVYDGKSTTQVLFENNAQDSSVVYNAEDKKYTITIGEYVITIEDSLIQIGEASESFVKGDTIKPELQKNIDALTQLQSDFSSWTPVPNDGGASLKAILATGFGLSSFADLSDMLSDKIKGE